MEKSVFGIIITHSPTISNILNTRSWLWLTQKHIWNIIEEIVFEKRVKVDNFWRKFLQLCFKYVSEQILTKSWCLKHQKSSTQNRYLNLHYALLKTLGRLRSKPYSIWNIFSCCLPIQIFRPSDSSAAWSLPRS